MVRTLPQLLLAIAILALIVIGASQYTAEEGGDHLRVWFFDVGQGDAILLDTPEKQQILIDGGPDASVVGELSRALPLTDKDLDLVIVTHNHSDHLKGINEVLRHYKVDKLWISGAIHTTETYKDMLEIVKAKRIPTEIVVAGSVARYGQLEGVVLHPLESQLGLLPDNQHDADIVTYWQYGQQTLLLTGDAEDEHEQAMLSRGLLRPVTILKVGHHGSRTSSSAAFLRSITPKVAVIQLGQNNRFGHPAQSTIDRLVSLKIPILRTDQVGTIRFSIWPDRTEYATF